MSFPYNTTITLQLADAICKHARRNGRKSTLENAFRFGLNIPEMRAFLKRNADMWVVEKVSA